MVNVDEKKYAILTLFLPARFGDFGDLAPKIENARQHSFPTKLDGTF